LRSQGRVPVLMRPFCLWILLVLCLPAVADPLKRQSKIICRDELSQTRRVELAGKLRLITGWRDLEFDKSGSLRTGDSTVGGSESARNFLSKALSGTDIVILEDSSNRSDVVFCKVIPGRWKDKNPSQVPPVHVVLIDFADFDHLMGDRLALRAFDPAWGLLHEIDHVLENSDDPDKLGSAGHCEHHINQMRRELGLPARSEYFFTLFPQTEFSGFSARYVRLAFDQEDAASRKHRRYWIMWDATLVGGLSDTKQVAGLR
jgi:hypothetical protein